MSESFYVKENKRRSRFLHRPQQANGRLSVGPPAPLSVAGMCVSLDWAAWLKRAAQWRCWWWWVYSSGNLARGAFDTRSTTHRNRRRRHLCRATPDKSETVNFNQHPELWKLICSNHTLILYLFLTEALRAKTAGGGPNSGIPMAEVRLRLQRSHSGRQVFSPNLDETVHARQGQHQKP